jgi:hypothetical protein
MNKPEILTGTPSTGTINPQLMLAGNWKSCALSRSMLV